AGRVSMQECDASDSMVIESSLFIVGPGIRIDRRERSWRPRATGVVFRHGKNKPAPHPKLPPCRTRTAALPWADASLRGFGGRYLSFTCVSARISACDKFTFSHCHLKSQLHP